MKTRTQRNKQLGSTLVEYLVALVFGLVVVWQTADMVMENLVEHQEEYVQSMASPIT